MFCNSCEIDSVQLINSEFLQWHRYRDVSWMNFLAIYCLLQYSCIVILSLSWAIYRKGILLRGTWWYPALPETAQIGSSKPPQPHKRNKAVTDCCLWSSKSSSCFLTVVLTNECPDGFKTLHKCTYLLLHTSPLPSSHWLHHIKKKEKKSCQWRWHQGKW